MQPTAVKHAPLGPGRGIKDNANSNDPCFPSLIAMSQPAGTELAAAVSRTLVLLRWANDLFNEVAELLPANLTGYIEARQEMLVRD